MKIITEIIEDSYDILQEKLENGDKKLHIQGIFMQSEKKNRNGRVYPRGILEREVNRYIKSHVKENRALGELGHPSGPKINEDRASHLITDLRFEGNDVIGKAKILSTATGNTVRALIEDGVKLGVSSRGLGTVKEKNGINEVQKDFYLATVDIVTDPSGPDCFVNGIMEGVEFWYDPSKGIWKKQEVESFAEEVDMLRTEVKKMSSRQILENKQRIFAQYLEMLANNEKI